MEERGESDIMVPEMAATGTPTRRGRRDADELPGGDASPPGARE